MDFYDTTLKYFKENKVVLADRFAPFYVCSTTMHLLNLANYEREFYYEQGKVANLRLHVMFCAPPGFMKTLMMERLLDPSIGVIGPSSVETGMEGHMTEAAFVGTYRLEQGQPTEVQGAAYEHRRGIVGVDEFQSLANAMKQEHSLNLDNAMLTALDSGYVLKKVSLGKVNYRTNMTLWAGSQPTRFDLASGLARRFCFVFFIPTPKEEKMIRVARREGKNIRPNYNTLGLLQQQVETITNNLKLLQELEFTDSLNNALDEINVPHYEEILFEKMAIGYNVATKKVGRTLKVTVDDRLMSLFKQEKIYRNKIKKGADVSEVLDVINNMNLAKLSDVKDKLTDFGLSYNKTAEILQNLQRQGHIDIKTMDSHGNGKKVKVIIVNE